MGMRTTHVQTSKTGGVAPGTGEWLTRREIAARLKKTPRTIDSYVRKGFLPHIKVGRTVMFRWPDVEKHLIEHFGVLRTTENRHSRSKLNRKAEAPCGPVTLQPEPFRVDR